MLISAVILASASSSSCVRGWSRWAPLLLRGASWRSCKRRLVLRVCSLVDCRTDFRAEVRGWHVSQVKYRFFLHGTQSEVIIFCKKLTLIKIMEFLWNPSFQFHFSFLYLFLFFRFFGFGFCHFYRFLNEGKKQMREKTAWLVKLFL